jgi:esterase
LYLNYKVQGVLDHLAPVIMLHGLLGSLDNWNAQARQLSQYRTVITVDLRNHGQSPHLKGMSYGEMAQDVMALLDHLQVPQCALMGHSMGGKVAMMLALHYPHRIQQLVVVDIAPKSYTPRHYAILQGMMRLPLAEISRRKQADDYLAQWITSPIDRGFLLKNLKRSSADQYNTSHNQNIWYWQCNLNEISRQYLKLSAFPDQAPRTYTQPCLFIQGGKSDYIQVQDKEIIQQYFPNARIQALAQAGHLPHIETIEAFHALLLKFLQL